ncbi:hypothetical protein BV20DRAFT_971775 [Pilatotrama ljubarskyi]|nr:hypothetical protein BV20DRAFT_971775 [Pilatotrama ljubarskyi]
MSATSHTPSPSPSRSPTPEPPVQPDHFYGNEDIHLPPSPSSDGRTWLDPADDPLAQRGIPVFKPTMDEFVDFEGYMNKVEPWGMRSGIVKIIPPKEWTDALPSVVPQLDKIKLKNPIEQHMIGQAGLFQQQNIEKRRVMSVREWAEMCAKEELRAPAVDEVGLHARAANGSARTRTRRGRKNRQSDTAEPEPMNEDAPLAIKHEDEDIGPEEAAKALISPPNSNRTLSPPERGEDHSEHDQSTTRPGEQASSSADAAHPSKSRHPSAEEEEEEDEDDDAKQSIAGREGEEGDAKPKSKGKRAPQTREAREAMMAERAAKDREFLQSFDPHTAWLPPKTSSSSYTADFCKELERRYWRNCGFGKPAWYGADMQGSLFTDETTSWNVAHLPSALSRLLPASNKGLPGVNTPYLYFGMWRATFAWHVEDMDLFSINYIHFGAPKFWYAMPQARANALEQTMKSLFPGAGKNCSQFLRHKSYLASPTLLSKSSCKPNYLVQQAGEFVITFPRGYHAGFNLGFNCAESVNFALESWIDIGRKAKACGCVNFSVRIDVDKLLRDRAAENREVYRKAKKPPRTKNDPAPGKEAKPKPPSRKRKAEGDVPTKAKKQRTSKPASASKQSVASSSKVTLPPASPSKQMKVTLKLPPKPKEPETFPCCLCASMSREDLLRVHDPPSWWYEPGVPEAAGGRPCMAHVECANVVPETWVDEVEVGEPDENGVRRRERVIFGVDGIVKDRWNLKCTACTKTRNRTHGAPIQCTKGKCPKAFHVSCARDGSASGIVYRVLREVEKEVVLLDNQATVPPPAPTSSAPPETASIPIDPALAGEQPMDVDLGVVTLSEPPATQPQPQQQHQPSPSPQVLKRIKKTEVEVLCHQHNPAILAAKKAQQQDRIRNQLLALPPMSRIKLRVTAGVFEVTLLRVLEESHAVEVLWDRGLRREFKWRSVVFGETDAVVGHKPTEAAAPEHDAATSAPRATDVTMRVSHPPSGSVPPPSYRPSPAPQSQSHTPVAGQTSHSHTPTNTSPPPPGTQRPATTYGAASSLGYPQQTAYQPRTSTYKYAPGSWTYQYPGSSYPRSTYQYAGTPGHPAGPSYPSSCYVPPSYPQSAYGTPGVSTYQHAYGRSAYGTGYQPYGGYSYAEPPPLPAAVQGQATPPCQPQAASSTAAVAPPPNQAQQRGLQWQKPYTGPREPPATKSPPLMAPDVSRAPSYPAAQAGASQDEGYGQSGGRPSSANASAPASSASADSGV